MKTRGSSRVAVAVKKRDAIKKPKKPKPPFFFFLDEYRLEDRKEHPHDRKIAQVHIRGAEKWGEMTEAEKFPYILMGEKGKNDFNTAMDEYKKLEAEPGSDEEDEPGSDEEDEPGSDEEDESDDPSLSAKKRKTDMRDRSPDNSPNRPKRPPSSFFLFMLDFEKEYKEKHPKEKKRSAILKAGGEEWRVKSKHQKDPYTKRANIMMAEFKGPKEALNNQQAETMGTEASGLEATGDSESESPGGREVSGPSTKSEVGVAAGGGESIPHLKDATNSKAAGGPSGNTKLRVAAGGGESILHPKEPAKSKAEASQQEASPSTESRLEVDGEGAAAEGELTVVHPKEARKRRRARKLFRAARGMLTCISHRNET